MTIKSLIALIISLCVFVMGTIILISNFRSTNETYVCSGIHSSIGKHPKQIHVSLKLENQKSGLLWEDYSWTSVNLPLVSPDVFYVSNFTSNIEGKNYIDWNTTYYGTNLNVYARSNNSILYFDFKTKILSMSVWDKTGSIKESDYNLLCTKA
jgi:hypothetical protein